MVGRATLTMKKSSIGRKAPSRTVTSPAVPRAGPAGEGLWWVVAVRMGAGAGASCRVTGHTIRCAVPGYQSEVIRV